MDYKELLKKYMDHVGQCEGIYFLADWRRTEGFTDEEWNELIRLVNEPEVRRLDAGDQ